MCRRTRGRTVGRSGGQGDRRTGEPAGVQGHGPLAALVQTSAIARRPHPTARPRFLALLLLALAFLAPPLQAQDTDLERSRRRLEEIRKERDRLQRQQERLQGQVHDVNDELHNLERQRESTQKIVDEIERQIGGLSSQLDRTSAELILAEDNLAERRAVLERRLVDIYKRGALYTFQALLAAESFGDLLSRYKYLYLTSRQDRALVGDVEKLRNRVVTQRDDLLDVRKQLDRTREEREAEYSKFTELVEARARRLRQLRRTARTTEQRLVELRKDEARLNDVLASLERARRDEAARSPRGAAPVPGSITTADIGRLDWPVEGAIVYRFGRDTLPSGGIIRWNGVGIAAGPGTPVKAVESGKVRLVGQFGTYGLTVVLEHGNGYYSVYSHLQSAAVQLSANVARGQTIGAVGGENSDYGPHLHFEIRGENQVALNPVDWLRKR
jgi:murein hydrolase activator